jgi:hypothetical protein
LNQKSEHDVPISDCLLGDALFLLDLGPGNTGSTGFLLQQTIMLAHAPGWAFNSGLDRRCVFWCGIQLYCSFFLNNLMHRFKAAFFNIWISGRHREVA